VKMRFIIRVYAKQIYVFIFAYFWKIGKFGFCKFDFGVCERFYVKVYLFLGLEPHYVKHHHDP
jgi:hypothetical protein